MTLAIDFDGTIVEEIYPGIGPEIENAKKYINLLFDEGFYIIIWTCRTDIALLEAEMFLHDNGFKFHKINEHKPHQIHKYGNNGRKISADIYIDNKNLGGLPSWEEIYKLIYYHKDLGTTKKD